MSAASAHAGSGEVLSTWAEAKLMVVSKNRGTPI